MKRTILFSILALLLAGCGNLASLNPFNNGKISSTIGGIGSVIVLLDEYDDTRDDMIAEGTKACKSGLFTPDECAIFKKSLLQIDALVDTIRRIAHDDGTLTRIGAIGDLSVSFTNAESAYTEARSIVQKHFDKLDIDTQRKLQKLDADAKSFARAMTVQLYAKEDAGFSIGKLLGTVSKFAKTISKFAVLI